LKSFLAALFLIPLAVISQDIAPGHSGWPLLSESYMKQAPIGDNPELITPDYKYRYFSRFDEGNTDEFYLADASADKSRKINNNPGKVQEDSSVLFTQLQGVLDNYRSELKIVGASAAVVSEDGLRWTGTSGNSSYDVPVRRDMLFGIGSVTKTYVSALILKYVELGFLNLDDVINKWIDDRPYVDSRITVRQLLNHTSGLYNYMAHPDFNTALYNFPDTFWTASIILDSFLKEAVGEPGQKWEYSAANYLLLGMIIERISGNPANEEIRTEILTPLGLENTYLYPQEVYGDSLMAHLWMTIDSTGIPVDINPLVSPPPLSGLFSSVWTAGGMHSTALDVSRWLTDLFGGRFLSKISVNEMIKPTPESEAVQYGLGLVTEEIGGIQTVGHSGGIGYSSIAVYYPRDRISITILCNSEADPRPILIGLYNAVISR
jgi:D-alanyl-D-alanine carboxypeptidase